MKEYRKVLKFKFNDNNYNMYLDNKNKKFFLGVDAESNLRYLKIEELMELINELTSIPNVMNIKKDNKNNKLKIVPKIVIGGSIVGGTIIGGTSVLLSTIVLSTAISLYKSNKRIEQFEEEYVVSNSIEEYLSTSETEENDDLIVDTYLESSMFNYLFIYDMDYLDKALDYDNVSLEQLNNAIENNSNISSEYKELLYEYCDAVVSKYPNIDFRVLYENLKTLEVIECDEQELLTKTLSVGTYGCYVKSENKIYVKEGYQFEKGTWEYQVIFHEFSHCLRTGTWNLDGKEVKVQVNGQNYSDTITSEALNSLFTVSLFDYEELDIAYQLQSNYHKIMIECMDNYDLSDYINHSLSYYADKLDEYNEDDNYATTILQLIEMQYNDYHSTSISVEQSEYYPIYDYISDMYYKENLTSDMNYDDAKRVADNLLNKVLYDVPEDYNIDTSYFYEHLNEYCRSIGIENNSIYK